MQAESRLFFAIAPARLTSLTAERRVPSRGGLLPPESRGGLELIAILCAIWAAFALYAASDRSLRVFGHELEKSDVGWLRQATALRSASSAKPQRPKRPAPQAALLGAAPVASAPSPRVVDEGPQRILILGDSMIEGLLPRLADYAVENGHSVNAVIWYGSRTIDWAKTSRLGDALRDYRPTFVILVIGSSELTTRDVEKRAVAVERILKTVGNRKVVWIGPPNWRADTGLGALLEQSVGSDRFFRSFELGFDRRKDGIHPTLASSERWMDAVATFVVEKSTVPIRLAPPKKTGTPRPSIRAFAPPAP